jgi:hypothetical protein
MAGHQVCTEDSCAPRDALEAVHQHTTLRSLERFVDEAEALLKDEEEVGGGVVLDGDPQVGEVLWELEANNWRKAEDVVDSVTLEGGQIIGRSYGADRKILCDKTRIPYSK